MKQTTLFK